MNQISFTAKILSYPDSLDQQRNGISFLSRMGNLFCLSKPSLKWAHRLEIISTIGLRKRWEAPLIFGRPIVKEPTTKQLSLGSVTFSCLRTAPNLRNLSECRSLTSKCSLNLSRPPMASGTSCSVESWFEKV